LHERSSSGSRGLWATSDQATPTYVLDTQGLYWYWTDPARLGPAAESAFRALEQRAAIGLIPTLVIAEIHYLTGKRGMPLSVDSILRLLDRAPALRLESLTRQHLTAFGRLSDIPEMHDRLIAAAGLLHDAVVVTRDPHIRAHPMIRTAW
jgi:PIN domain nuclease of toxin-antitoxin system